MLTACAASDVGQEPTSSIKIAIERSFEDGGGSISRYLAPSFSAGETVGLSRVGYLSALQNIEGFFPGLLVDEVLVEQTPVGYRSTHVLRTPDDEEIAIEQRFIVEDKTVTSATVSTNLNEAMSLAAPFTPSAKRTPWVVDELATFAPGAFPEGLAQLDDGRLLISLLFSNEILAYDEARGLTLFARLPFEASPGRGLFCLTPDGDGGVYATVAGPPPQGGIWQISSEGEATAITPLPAGVAPNGITTLPDGAILFADTFGGKIWKVDPTTSETELWIEDVLLKPKPFIGLFPGINGLQRGENAVIATVSDTGAIVRIAFDRTGKAKRLELMEQTIAGDDFDISQTGDIFLTTHPFNTVERLEPNGTRSELADANAGVVGPTAAILDESNNREPVLYVITDGGLYRPLASGLQPAKLLKLTPAPNMVSSEGNNDVP